MKSPVTAKAIRTPITPKGTPICTGIHHSISSNLSFHPQGHKNKIRTFDPLDSLKTSILRVFTAAFLKGSCSLKFKKNFKKVIKTIPQQLSYNFLFPGK
jgi:hypothetical protein